METRVGRKSFLPVVLIVVVAMFFSSMIGTGSTGMVIDHGERIQRAPGSVEGLGDNIYEERGERTPTLQPGDSSYGPTQSSEEEQSPRDCGYKKLDDTGNWVCLQSVNSHCFEPLERCDNCRCVSVP